MGNLHAIDVSVIVAYLILCLFIGLYKAGKIKTIREYTLGTGYISTAVLFFTIFATHIGAGSTVGEVEALHSMGLIFAISMLAQPLIWVVTAKIFVSNIQIFKDAGCMSVSDIMGFLYGKPGKWITNVFAMLLSIGVIAVQIGAIGYLFNYFLGITHELGIFIGFGALVVYSLFGGIRAVALTDTFQGLVLLVAIPIACIVAFHTVGGYDGLINGLPKTHLSIDWTKDNVLLLASLLFYAVMPAPTGVFVQRFLMANDSKQLARSLKLVALVSVPFTMVLCLIGFVIKVKAPEVEPNTAFFYLIGNYLPIGITGLLISGILAAIMSTADSWLNTTSVLCAHDIAKGIFPQLTDKQELFIARLAVLGISCASVLLALEGKSLIGLIWLAENFWLPIVLIPLALGFLKFSTNSKSFISSTALGIAGVLFGRYFTGSFATVSLLFGVVGSALGLLGTHYWQVLFLGRKVGDDKFFGYSEPNRNKISSAIVAPFIKGIEKQSAQYKEYSYLLGVLGIIYFLGSSFFMVFTDVTILYTVVYLKATAAILCFGLCVYEFHFTPEQQAKYMPIYWYSTLCYCFPFLSSYTVLIYEGSLPWLINLMLSGLLLFIFGGWFTAVFLSILGFAAAYLLFKYTGYSLAVHAGDQPKMLGYIYCLLTGAILLILKHRDMLQARDLQSRVLYGAAVAHEVINPLQGSAMIADVLINTFKGKDRPDQLSQEAFEGIKGLLDPFKENSTAALKTVDRLLTLVRTDVDKADDIGIYDIDECVESALKSYGLNEKSLSRIQVNKENSFEFKGSKHFMGHVINNLISNALKYAGANSKIEIWYEGQELHFKDDGQGISANKLPYIFRAFDKNGSTEGTGVGLPFCKRVMEGMGGDIECKSHLGKGTEFILKFSNTKF